jgi:hypothetical protein
MVCRARRGVRPGGALAASPNWYQTSKTAASRREPLAPKAPCADPTAPIRLGSGPSCTVSVPVRPGSGLAYPWRSHRTDLPVAPRRVPKMRARRPPPHWSKDDVSFLRSSLGPRLDMVRRLGWLRFSQVSHPRFRWYSQRLMEVRHHQRLQDGCGSCDWVPTELRVREFPPVEQEILHSLKYNCSSVAKGRNCPRLCGSAVANDKADNSTRLIRMIQRKAGLGKRNSSLASWFRNQKSETSRFELS